MLRTDKIKWIQQLINIFELIAVMAVLLMAFFFQIVLHELPCPLCTLQRIGFAFIALGFILNLRFGFKPSHYSIVLLGAIFTAFVALRQVALHVIPGTGAYGSSILGLHMYTWSFILAVLIIIASAFLLGIDQQYQDIGIKERPWKKSTNILFALLTLVLAANIISLVLECGFQACPDNPVRYELLSHTQSV